uniref:Uncharacterized protein n=1 Tax=Oryza rufipogon TaxID=4529 RepID=A0A0E0QWD2_ORYRU
MTLLSRAGSVVIEQFADKVPKTTENFRLMCTGGCDIGPAPLQGLNVPPGGARVHVPERRHRDGESALDGAWRLIANPAREHIADEGFESHAT